LPEAQAAQIEAAAVDMWPAYAAAVATQAPQAEIVHDLLCRKPAFSMDC
jgi:transposase